PGSALRTRSAEQRGRTAVRKTIGDGRGSNGFWWDKPVHVATGRRGAADALAAAPLSPLVVLATGRASPRAQRPAPRSRSTRRRGTARPRSSRRGGRS